MTKKLEEFRAVEEFDISESEFSVEEGTGKLKANVRIIKAGMSKNRRNYRESALKESVTNGIWNGVRMFANHSKVVPLQRPIGEMVAAIESTTYNEKDKAVDAKVEFFNKEFYEFAQRAKDYMGDSINAMVQGYKVPDGKGQVTEDIHRIVQPRSVDFVIYPSAGGMIHSFEGEGKMINWGDITLKDIKESAPELYAEAEAEIKAALPKVEPVKEPVKDEKKPEIEGLISRKEADEMIKEAISGRDKEVKETQNKVSAVGKKLIEAFGKSGLPEPVQKRVMSAYEGVTEYDEAAVTESINEAKEELKALGLGPRITGQGPSGAAGNSSTKNTFSAQESVEAAFNMKKAPAKTDKKEGE